jgi:DNA polymerase-3 subunit epsilon
MRALDHVIVVDTETGGLDPLHHSLLSVGLVSGDGTRTLEFYVLEPTLTTDERSMAVNRIDLDRVRAEGLSPEKAVDRIEAFLDGIGRGRPLKAAGHNVAFDIAFLRRLYRMAGRDFPPDFAHRTIDTHTLLWALAQMERLPKDVVSSDKAFAHFDLAPPDALRHTALGDAVATHQLLQRLLPLLG